MSKRKYSKEFKLKVLKEHEEGASCYSLEKKYGIYACGCKIPFSLVIYKYAVIGRFLNIYRQRCFLKKYILPAPNNILTGIIIILMVTNEMSEEFPYFSTYIKMALYPVGEYLYTVFSDGVSGGSFTSYDKEQKSVLSQNLKYTISGCISQDSECLWYGFDEKGELTVWDRLNGVPRYSLGNMVNAYEAFLLTRSADGNFFLANTGGIWVGDGSESLEKVSLPVPVNLFAAPFSMTSQISLGGFGAPVSFFTICVVRKKGIVKC